MEHDGREFKSVFGGGGGGGGVGWGGGKELQVMQCLFLITRLHTLYFQGGVAWYSGLYHCLPLQGSAIQFLLGESLLVLFFVFINNCLCQKILNIMVHSL